MGKTTDQLDDTFVYAIWRFAEEGNVIHIIAIVAFYLWRLWRAILVVYYWKASFELQYNDNDQGMWFFGQ